MEEADGPDSMPAMPQAPRESEQATSAGAHRDWASIIRRRLAGTTPRHAPEEWMIPGRFEPGDGRRLLPREQLEKLLDPAELTTGGIKGGGGGGG